MNRWSRIATEGVVIVALATAILWPLRSSYSSNAMLLVGFMGALCATVIAGALARLSVFVLIPGLFLGWLLLAGPFALRSPGLGLGIPNGDTLADVMTGTATGWNDLLTTWPLVDVNGPPAMVPFVISYVVAGLSASLAFRGHSPGLPAVPMVAGAVVAMAVSVRGGVDPWIPFLLAVLIMVWVLVRGLVYTDPHIQVTGATSGLVGRGVVMVLALALATGAAYVFIGNNRTDSGLTLRGHVGTLPDTTGFDNPLSRFRTFTKQRLAANDNVHNKPLFEVDGVPAGSRVRIVALDAYDGRQWTVANNTMPDTTDDRFLRMDTVMARKAEGPSVEAQVKIQRPYKSAWLPTVGAINSLSFVYTDEDNRRNKLLYNQATNSAVVPIGIGFGNDYDFAGRVPPDKLTPRMKPYPERLEGLKGLPEAHFFVRGLAGKRGTPMQKVFRIADYLKREGRYSDGSDEWEVQYLPGQDLKRLFGGFLGAPYVVGNDEQYAAAMALMANAAGVPARVVVGAILPESRVVQGKDIQAWVELRVADGSWRVLPREAFTGTQPPPRTYRPNNNLQPPKTQPQDQPQNQPEVKKQEKKKQQKRAKEAKKGWLKVVLPILAVLFLLLITPALKWRRRRRRRTADAAADRMAGAWAELVDTARDLGAIVPVGAARPTQAKELVSVASGPSLSETADRATFAEALPSDSQATAYWDQIDAEIAALKKSADPKRRLLAPFNPMTLFTNRSLD